MEAVYVEAVTRDPSDVQAWLGLARSYRERNSLFAAIGAAKRAAEHDPACLEAQLLLGRLALSVTDRQAAVGAFEAAARLAPDDAAVLRELADAYRRAGWADEALVTADRAYALAPADPAAAAALAAVFVTFDRLDAAEAMYLEALRRAPEFADAACGLGALYVLAGRYDDADAQFTRAARTAPQLAELRYNRAILDLARGDFARGFDGYRALIETRGDATCMRALASGVPLWNGEVMAGKHLLVAAEQGLGDQIMMARFLADVPTMSGARVTVEADARLVPLLARSFPALSIVAAASIRDYAEFDAHVPFTFLPGAFGIADRAELLSGVPYLAARPERIDAMRAALRMQSGVRNIGIVWHGNRRAARERRRGTALADWAPLREVADVRWHSLQFGADDAARADAPFALEPTDRLLHDLDDTAAAIAVMDLVISVDTATVHLAGAMDRPVWLANSRATDPRWGIAGESAPWYHSVRVFRQDAVDDWEPVFRRMAMTIEAAAK